MARSPEEEFRIYGPWSFRAWGYGLPCLVVACDTRDRRPGSVHVIEQCHTATGGMGRKGNWTETVFMCWRHHDEAHRGVERFERRNQLRVEALFEGLDVGTLREAAQVTQHLYRAWEAGLAL